MNRVSAISMMFIFVMNLAGGSGVLLWHRMQMHQRIERMIKAEAHSEILVTLTFTHEEAAQLNWFEEGREFKYNGDMYDIVHTIKDTEGITYHCINDTRETELYRQLEKDFEKENSTQDADAGFALQFFGFLSNLYCTGIPQADFLFIITTEKAHAYFKEYTSISRSIPCEPPEEIA